MHGENKDKKFYISRENFFKIFKIFKFFLTVLARAVFRTQPNVCGGAFLQKLMTLLMTFSC